MDGKNVIFISFQKDRHPSLSFLKVTFDVEEFGKFARS